MFAEFIHLLELVAELPEYPFAKGKFVKWDNIASPTRKLVAACPLTQVALRAGADFDRLQISDHPSDYVVDYLDDTFGLDKDATAFIWSRFDNGDDLMEIIAQFELEYADD